MQFALWPRRGRSRFAHWVGTWLALTAPANADRLRRSLSGFGAEAVVTVAHGYSWLAAAKFAENAGLPLHLIVHDHWPGLVPIHAAFRPWADLLFGRVYRRAASRLCVSPFMEEEYRRKYGARGEVLYPTRAKECPSFDDAPQTYRKKAGPLVGAYAGGIGTEYARLVAGLAECLGLRGGRLLIFGPHSQDDLKVWGLDLPNVLSQGLLTSAELVPRLRQEADFLFVPMAFDGAGVRYDMRIAFPSKLADYTATGLPLLVWGPEDCSAARWARLQGSVAEVVTSKGGEQIPAALERLERPQHRERLGLACVEVGGRLFPYGSSVKTLFRALIKGRSACPRDANAVSTPCSAPFGSPKTPETDR